MKQYKESIDKDILIFVSDEQIADFFPISHCFDTLLAKSAKSSETTTRATRASTKNNKKE